MIQLRTTNLLRGLVLSTACSGALVQADESDEPVSLARKEFTVDDRPAFIIAPAKKVEGPTPWVMYAPTLGRGLPGGAEHWMFRQFVEAGIAIAGVDVGESYGNPQGRATYQAFYLELTTKRGFSKKPVLLARSRGGLMLYGWAVEHPEAVGGIAGIYPVCNIASYPGVARAAPAYGMTADELQAKLSEHNPIDLLAPLAKANVPIYHYHGDKDSTVPLETNSLELKSRYDKLGGPMTLEVVKGQGHNMWAGWFENQKLVDFVIAQTRDQPLAEAINSSCGRLEGVQDTG